MSPSASLNASLALFPGPKTRVMPGNRTSNIASVTNRAAFLTTPSLAVGIPKGLVLPGALGVSAFLTGKGA
jgi:hypothetical protein